MAKYLKSIRLVNGLVQAVQFADIQASDVAGLGTAAFKNTGTSGDVVPLLNTSCTWAGAQTVLGTSLTVGDGTTVNGTLVVKNASRDMMTLDATDNCRLTLRAGSPHSQEMYLWARHPGSGGPTLGSSGQFFGWVVGSDTIEVKSDTPILSFRPSTNTLLAFVAKGGSLNAPETALVVGKIEASGTPGAGWGPAFDFYARSSTTTHVQQARIKSGWVVATHASRTSRSTWSAYDTAEREAVVIEASGSAAMVGFLGAGAVVRQASGANLTNNVTAGGTDDRIDDFADLTVYANDAAAIRNDIYQLARKLKQVNDALRLYGLLT